MNYRVWTVSRTDPLQPLFLKLIDRTAANLILNWKMIFHYAPPPFPDCSGQIEWYVMWNPTYIDHKPSIECRLPQNPALIIIHKIIGLTTAQLSGGSPNNNRTKHVTERCQSLDLPRPHGTYLALLPDRCDIDTRSQWLRKGAFKYQMMPSRWGGGAGAARGVCFSIWYLECYLTLAVIFCNSFLLLVRKNRLNVFNDMYIHIHISIIGT